MLNILLFFFLIFYKNFTNYKIGSIFFPFLVYMYFLYLICLYIYNLPFYYIKETYIGQEIAGENDRFIISNFYFSFCLII